MMDAFNPFANAWDDDNSNATAAASSFQLGNATVAKADDNSLPSWSGTSSEDTGLGQTDLQDEAWGAPSSESAFVPDRSHESGRLGAGWAPEDTGNIPTTHTDKSSWSPKLNKADSSWSLSQHEKPADLAYATEAGEDAQAPLEQESLDEYGDFGSEAIDLPKEEPTLNRRDSGDAWGATELPPSAWEERLNAKPVWKDPSEGQADVDRADGWGGANELDLNTYAEREEAANDVNEDGSHSATSPASASKMQKTDDERRDELAEIRRLQEEYGIQIRNLDEEHSSEGMNTTQVLANAKAQVQTQMAAASNRWSIFSKKIAAPEEVSGNMKSITTRISPRQSTSSTPPLTPASPDLSKEKQGGKDSQDKPPPVEGGSRWFRFGARGRNASAGTEKENASNAISPVTATSAAQSSQSGKATIDLAALDDFGKLEKFDSKAHANSNKSLFDDLGVGASEDLTAARKWSLFGRAGPLPSAGSVNAARSGKGKHSALGRDGNIVGGVNDDDDFEGLDEAFSAPPVPSTSQEATITGQSRNERATKGLEQRFGAMSMANMASTIRSSSSFDTFDPLDPLSELSNSDNKLYPSAIPGPSAQYADKPNTGVHRSTSITRSISPFPPRAPLSGDTARPRAVSIVQGTNRALSPTPTKPSSLPPPIPYTSTPSPPIYGQPTAGPPVVRMASNPISRPASTGPPAPLLAPPPSFSRKGSPSSPSSLLDEFADFTAAPAKPAAPSSFTVPSLLPPPSSSTSTAAAGLQDDDDFGEFADFTSASSSTTGFSPQKPNKANGPMKLAAPAPKFGVPLSASSLAKPVNQGVKRSGTPLSNDDLSFFDSL